jgi:flagellar biosynthetic protein FliR
MQFYLSQFMPLLATFIFVLARLSGALVSIPFISSNFVNMRTKASLVLMLAFIMTPMVVKIDIDLLSLNAVIIVAVQIILGLVMGFVFTVVLNVFVLAGELISMQAGLNMAVMNDPVSNASVPIVSQIYYILASVLFFVLDLPLQIVTLLFKSFKTFPISNTLFSRDVFEDVAMLGDYFYKMSFQIALPIVVILFLIQIALGIMTKSAPQFNIFSIGFPIIILISMLMIWGNLNGVHDHFNSLMNYALEVISGIYGISQ